VSDWKQSWEERVSELEAEGLTRSDAQGAVDVEILEGWRPRDFQPWMLVPQVSERLLHQKPLTPTDCYSKV